MKIKTTGMCLVWKYIENHGKTTLLKGEYSKTCVKRTLSKRPKNGFQDRLSLNAGQKYCRKLQREHSAIPSTCIKLLVVIKTLVLSIFEWPFYTGFTVDEILILKAEVLIIYPGYRILGHTFSFKGLVSAFSRMFAYEIV